MRFIKSFGWAANGFRTVLREEFNFRVQAVVAVLVIALGFVRGLSSLEWVAIVFAVALVLMAEIVNTAVEDICNKIEPNQDPAIGRIKDMMAGYVLLSSVAAVTIGLIIFI